MKALRSGRVPESAEPLGENPAEKRLLLGGEGNDPVVKRKQLRKLPNFLLQDFMSDSV